MKQEQVQYEMYSWETKASIGLVVDNEERRGWLKRQLKEGGIGENHKYVYFIPVSPDPNQASLREVLRQVLRDTRTKR